MRRTALLAVLGISLLSTVAQAFEKAPASEFHARRVALSQKLDGGVAVLFAAEEPLLDFTPYRQDSDFYYLTGWTEPGAALVIEAATPESTDPMLGTVAAEPYREILFLPTRNLRMEQYTGAKLDAATAGAAAKAGVDEVRPMSDLVAELDRVTHGDVHHNFARRKSYIFAEQDSPQPRATMELLAASLGSSDPIATHDVHPGISALRNMKSPDEVTLLRKAADASVVSQRSAMRAIHPGVGENVIEGLIYYKLRSEGCERPSYASIVGSGPFSTQLHYSADNRVMQSGDLVVIDAAGEYSMYANDITRTMPVNGHFTARQREIYEIVLGAQQAAEAAFVSGTSVLGGINMRGPEVKNALDKVAYDYINSHGRDSHGEPLGKYFIHGLGHGVGLDVHDPLPTTQPIGPGTFFTIEPGVYIPEEHIGVRIEDTFYVDPNGKLVNLSADLPHTPEEVEAAMRSK